MPSTLEYYELRQEACIMGKEAVSARKWVVSFKEDVEGPSVTTAARNEEINKYSSNLKQLVEADVGTITLEMISTIRQVIADAYTDQMVAVDELRELLHLPKLSK
jgi:hypothetical protein